MQVIYAIRDVKQNSFLPQMMLFPTDAAATRTFGDAVNAGQGDFYAHPEDYELYRLGSIDLDTGEYFYPVDGTKPPVFVVRGDSLVRKE